MAATRYVALIRGINVGGRNPVSMKDLKAEVESLGYGAVGTYIQSGNVIFETDRPAAGLEQTIERALEARYQTSLVVVVRSHRQLRAIVDQRPTGFGDHPTKYHSDVVFLRAPLTPAAAMKVVQLRDGVDQVWTGTKALYFARLSAKRTQSKMSKIVGTDAYKLMTIRSWSTTTKLLAMLDERAAPIGRSPS